MDGSLRSEQVNGHPSPSLTYGKSSPCTPPRFCSYILFNCDVRWKDHRHPTLPSLNDAHTSFQPLLSKQVTKSAGSPETHGQDFSRQSAFCPEAIKDDIVGALFLFILCNEAPN